LVEGEFGWAGDGGGEGLEGRASHQVRFGRSGAEGSGRREGGRNEADPPPFFSIPGL